MRIAPDFAFDPAPRNKFDCNAVELPRYASIERDFSGEVQRMVGDFLGGRTNQQTLTNAFAGRLLDAETEAFVAGRRARGDTRTTISDSEAEMLSSRHDRNMRYFRSFVDDMASGRGRMSYMQRADQYAKSLWSIYTRGETSDWQKPENVNARYYWVMDPDAEHCTGCIQRAKDSRDNDGFSWDDLSERGWPGEKTPCGVHCRCHVRVVKKSLVLPERFDDVAMAANANQGYQTLEDLLGGEDMPLKIPAAGIPYVEIAPETVHNSLRAVGDEHEALARRLPLIPSVLTSPEDVWERLGTRYYTGKGMTIATERDDRGLWRILALLLNTDWRKAA